MATPIQMPSLSPTMTEGKILKWLKKEGDKVSSGDAIAEVETDKSNLEIEAYDDGVLLKITVPEGEMAKVGAPIAFIGAKGEKIDASAAAAPAPAQKAAAEKAPAAPPQKAPEAAPAPQGGGMTAIQMPSLSPTMTEGKILRWLKKEGDKVSSGDPLAEIETDKSNLEIEAYDDGVLAKIHVGEGQMAKVGATIAELKGKGGKAAAPAPQAPAAAAAAPAAPKVETKVEAPRLTPSKGGRVRASPLAKKIAREKGLEISQVSGSGPQGRIVKRDVEAAVSGGVAAGAKAAPRAAAAPGKAAPFAAPAFGRQEPTHTPISQMRKVIAQRMGEVKPGVPHFYLTVEIEMDAALKIREEAKALESKVSVNDIIVKAAGVALKRYPKINVSYQGDKVAHFSNADVGVAVAIEDGLITPVVKDADLKGLAVISAEVRDLADRAKRRALKPEEYTGGSLTVSNLGMYGIDEFIAVINPPQASILAVGSVQEKAVVRNGQIVARKMMSITLSGDHRVIDGAVGAEYLRELKALLEHPMRLLF